MEEKLLEEWQERLGLQDWIIKLNINCNRDDLEDNTSTGETTLSQVHKAARMCIISKEEYGQLMLDYDFEKTLVHELLHLKFSFIEQNLTDTLGEKVLDSNIHQLLDDLARALVMAKRGETKRHLAKDCKIIDDYNERS